MSFDVVITTLNRPESCFNLVKQVLLQAPGVGKVIVVDSSDEILKINGEYHKVEIIHSSQKSQPYQRKLGGNISKAEIILFLDDDLKILQPFEQDLISAFSNKEIVGVSFGMDLNYGIGKKSSSKLRLKFLEGVSRNIPPGKIWYCGLTGGLPSSDSKVDFFYGGVMAFRREIIPIVISDELISLSLEKILMGEDKAISMNATKMGSLYFYAKKYFHHPLNESSYYGNEREYQRRVIFSRYYLSLVFAGIQSKNTLQAIFFFYIYLFFGFFKHGLKFIFSPIKTWTTMSGWMNGWGLTIKPGFIGKICAKYQSQINYSFSNDGAEKK